MPSDTLTIIDNRNGQQQEIAVSQGSVRALDLRKIRTDPEDFGLMTYDPGFANTACCRSRITFIDGDRGILWYRGYPIEQIAERKSFMETAYLVYHGEFPDSGQLQTWEKEIGESSKPDPGIWRVLSGFRPDCGSMALLTSGIASLSAFHGHEVQLGEEKNRNRHLVRLIAQVPVIAAYVYRLKRGLTPIQPEPERSFTENFLHMVFGDPEGEYSPSPIFVKALDVLFVLHADHEQNCSTNAMRSVGSSKCDPYLAAAASAAALAGPLHGGANEAVLKMLNEIGSLDQVPSYVKRAKSGEFRLMGFGHRVYKNYDPRARIIKRLADQVLEVTGSSPLLDVARGLEKIALQDEYFVSRKLYPNVDFYSGLIYQALGFPTWMFTLLFAVARTVGWAAQWEEMTRDREQRIARPLQIYEGPAKRDVP